MNPKPGTRADVKDHFHHAHAHALTRDGALQTRKRGSRTAGRVAHNAAFFAARAIGGRFT
jgi:hypothetical protein